MPAVTLRRPAGIVQKTSTNLMKRPCSVSIMRRPSVFVMPILVKKGQALMARRKIGYKRASRGYTRVQHQKVDKSRVNDMMGFHSVVHLRSAQHVKRMLTSKGLLPVRRHCHRCGAKVKKGIYERRSGDYGYRCTNSACWIRINRLHGHPIFHLSRRGLELAQQAALVSAMLHATSLVNIHVQMGISHRAIEDMALHLRRHIQHWAGTLG